MRYQMLGWLINAYKVSERFEMLKGSGNAFQVRNRRPDF
jgi:hypothetical protein